MWVVRQRSMVAKYRTKLLVVLAVGGLLVCPLWVLGFLIGRKAVPRDTMGWLSFRVCEFFTYCLLAAVFVGAISACIVPGLLGR